MLLLTYINIFFSFYEIFYIYLQCTTFKVIFGSNVIFINEGCRGNGGYHSPILIIIATLLSTEKVSLLNKIDNFLNGREI